MATSSTGYFEFSLENGLALIMTAGGGTPCGNNFVAGRDDVPFKVWGNYEMTIDDNNNVTICLRNMYSLIFPNKANYSAWFYFDTLWARSWNNCIPIHLDVGLIRQAHGQWSSGNKNGWQYATGYKGGTGIRGYDQWIKYYGDKLEAVCAGEYSGIDCCGAGSYIGSKKKLPDLCWSLGKVDFSKDTGFWIGANLGSYEGGWEQWQFVPFPVIVFEKPSINITNEVIDICEESANVTFCLESAHSLANGGGTWELQIADNPSYSNAMALSKVSSGNIICFTDVRLSPNKKYYVRGRIKVSGIRYSSWAGTIYQSNVKIPNPTGMVDEITGSECFLIRHGYLVEGGVIE